LQGQAAGHHIHARGGIAQIDQLLSTRAQELGQLLTRVV
jgi:hypothetical protein